jgi:hypothetical protein
MESVNYIRQTDIAVVVADKTKAQQELPFFKTFSFHVWHFF